MIVLLGYLAGGAVPSPLYKTPGAPINARVADLLKRMTLDEKIAQLALPFGAHYPEDYSGYNITGLGATYPLSGGTTARNAWQKWMVEHTRLGIPTSFISETLHGGGGTIFPMPCLQGSMWNTAMVEAIASEIALEASVQGIDRGFSPVLHFCTDARFGRCEESFGEDPMIIAKLGAAATTGLAGLASAGAASTYLASPSTKIATEAKHFAVYGYGGRDGSMPAELSSNTLYDVYLKPWYHYAQAGGRAIMASHNEVNGLPMHANGPLLSALRNDFGFDGGLCASDAGDVASVAHFHVANDTRSAGVLAIKAGMDQELQFHGAAFPQLPSALAAGLVTQATIDRAVSNVLRQKFASGLFDNRADLLYVNETKVEATLDSPSRRALARRAAEEGIVLLRNAKAMLPLRGLGSAIKTVAVIGPNADNAHSTQGGYTNGNAHVVTVLAAVVEAANASGNAWRVVYERGACLGATPLCACPIPANDTVPGCGITDTGRVSIAAAVARAADVTILVLGDSSTILAGNGSGHHEEGTCGEHFDRDNLDPVGAQLPLLKAVAAASSKVILTLIHGRPMTFGANPSDGSNSIFEETVPATLAAWRPGEEGGHAIWSIINGSVNPSGRSAHTWPRTVGQIRQYTPWYKQWGTRHGAYADASPATPLIPFGFGLSYTQYTLANLRLSHANSTALPSDAPYTAAESVVVSIDVSSVGPAGRLVIQCYFQQTLASRVRFEHMLLGWAKVDVAANAKATTTTFALKIRDVEMWSEAERKYVVEASKYYISCGQHSQDLSLVRSIDVVES